MIGKLVWRTGVDLAADEQRVSAGTRDARETVAAVSIPR